MLRGVGNVGKRKPRQPGEQSLARFGPPTLAAVGPWSLEHLDDVATAGLWLASGLPLDAAPDSRGVWSWRGEAYVEVVASFSTERLRVVELGKVVHRDGDVPRELLVDLARDAHRLAAAQHAAQYASAREAAGMEGTRQLTSWTPEHLADVARVYVEGGTRGRAAVAGRFHLSPHGASKQIAAARAAGLLTAAENGRAGGRLTTKARRILATTSKDGGHHGER